MFWDPLLIIQLIFPNRFHLPEDVWFRQMGKHGRDWFPYKTSRWRERWVWRLYHHSAGWNAALLYCADSSSQDMACAQVCGIVMETRLIRVSYIEKSPLSPWLEGGGFTITDPMRRGERRRFCRSSKPATICPGWVALPLTAGCLRWHAWMLWMDRIAFISWNTCIHKRIASFWWFGMVLPSIAVKKSEPF